jgi:hypothetical protein
MTQCTPKRIENRDSNTLASECLLLKLPKGGNKEGKREGDREEVMNK